MKYKASVLIFFWLAAARLALADPISLQDFKLTGDLAGGDSAVFTLTATARVDAREGGSLPLLSGPVALTGLGPHAKWDIRASYGGYRLVFKRNGVYPVEIKFNAAVQKSNDWNTVSFQVAAGTLQPVVFQGLTADTQFVFPDAARPERVGANFQSILPVNGAVNFSWKEAQREAEGK